MVLACCSMPLAAMDLLHSEGQEIDEIIVAKAAKALVEGGLLLAQECILDDNRTAPLHPALFSLNMLILAPRMANLCPEGTDGHGVPGRVQRGPTAAG